MNKERDYFFDNLKAVLIFLVVLGHFLLPIHGESVLVVVKRLIYVFHMPLFVFVSGYFAKKIYKNGQYNFKKILYLIKAYIIFVIAISFHPPETLHQVVITTHHHQAPTGTEQSAELHNRPSCRADDSSSPLL